MGHIDHDRIDRQCRNDLADLGFILGVIDVQ
jgi:hypothetical protein